MTLPGLQRVMKRDGRMQIDGVRVIDFVNGVRSCLLPCASPRRAEQQSAFRRMARMKT
jgi:hypothetical protein